MVNFQKNLYLPFSSSYRTVILAYIKDSILPLAVQHLLSYSWRLDESLENDTLREIPLVQHLCYDEMHHNQIRLDQSTVN